jgi:hypothetical protein
LPETHRIVLWKRELLEGFDQHGDLVFADLTSVGLEELTDPIIVVSSQLLKRDVLLQTINHVKEDLKVVVQ